MRYGIYVTINSYLYLQGQALPFPFEYSDQTLWQLLWHWETWNLIICLYFPKFELPLNCWQSRTINRMLIRMSARHCLGIWEHWVYYNGCIKMSEMFWFCLFSWKKQKVLLRTSSGHDDPKNWNAGANLKVYQKFDIFSGLSLYIMLLFPFLFSLRKSPRAST